jgi:hypothetical protein
MGTLALKRIVKLIEHGEWHIDDSSSASQAQTQVERMFFDPVSQMVFIMTRGMTTSFFCPHESGIVHGKPASIILFLPLNWNLETNQTVILSRKLPTTPE